MPVCLVEAVRGAEQTIEGEHVPTMALDGMNGHMIICYLPQG